MQNIDFICTEEMSKVVRYLSTKVTKKRKKYKSFDCCDLLNLALLYGFLNFYKKLEKRRGIFDYCEFSFYLIRIYWLCTKLWYNKNVNIKNILCGLSCSEEQKKIADLFSAFIKQFCLQIMNFISRKSLKRLDEAGVCVV